MDPASIIIGIVIVCLCTIPFVYTAVKQKQDENRMILTLAEMAKKENCKITSCKLFGNSVIAIDEPGKFIFFYKKDNDYDSETRTVVNLNDIQKCRLVNINRSVGEKKKNVVVDKVELNFLPKDKSKSDISIVFFNSNESMQLNRELQLAMEWEEIVNKNLKSMAKT